MGSNRLAQTDDRDRDGPGGRVSWHVTLSLGGCVAGAGDGMDWMFDSEARPDRIAKEVINTTGALLAGRRWYDLALSQPGGLEGIYDWALRGPHPSSPLIP